MNKKKILGLVLVLWPIIGTLALLICVVPLEHLLEVFVAIGTAVMGIAVLVIAIISICVGMDMLQGNQK